jgi:heme-degrading monooxygenase HmoA
MPTIAEGQQLQTVITTFEVNPGTCADLLDTLTEAHDTFISRQPGFISSALHVNDAETRIASYTQWETREHFMSMLRSDEMRARNRRIAELCRSFEPVMYEVRKSFG